MRVTVTGGAGFLGSHLVEQLLKEGHHVRVIDNLTTGKIENLKPVLGMINFRQADVSTEVGASLACSNSDIVYHLAALPSVVASLRNPKASRKMCLGTTLAIAKAAKRFAVWRVVFASTCAVYGTPKKRVAVESDPVNPLSPYAESKFAGEQILRCLGEDSTGTDTVSFRLFNVYGPRQCTTGGYAAVIPAFARTYLDGNTPTINGDGKQTRDFVHVEDVVKAFVLAGHQQSQLHGRVFNIGSGKERNILSVCDAIRFWCDRVGEPEYGAPIEGETRYIYADIRSASQALGWKPTVMFANGIEDYVHWMRESGK